MPHAAFEQPAALLITPLAPSPQPASRSAPQLSSSHQASTIIWHRFSRRGALCTAVPATVPSTAPTQHLALGQRQARLLPAAAYATPPAAVRAAASAAADTAAHCVARAAARAARGTGPRRAGAGAGTRNWQGHPWPSGRRDNPRDPGRSYHPDSARRQDHPLPAQRQGQSRQKAHGPLTERRRRQAWRVSPLPSPQG